MGSTKSSVGRASDTYLQGHGFDPQLGPGVVSLSKILHPPFCFVLLKIHETVPKLLKNC